jgi:hypothetical protein
MIYVKGFHGTSSVDRKVSPKDSRGLYPARKIEDSFSGVCQSKADTKSSTDWWGGRRQDIGGESNVQRNRLRLSGNQWF